LYTPGYRFFLAWTILFLWYLSKGINQQYRADHIFNDLNDAYIAAQETFTHSMFTKDKGVKFISLNIAKSLEWQGVFFAGRRILFLRDVITLSIGRSFMVAFQFRSARYHRLDGCEADTCADYVKEAGVISIARRG